MSDGWIWFILAGIWATCAAGVALRNRENKQPGQAPGLSQRILVGYLREGLKAAATALLVAGGALMIVVLYVALLAIGPYLIYKGITGSASMVGQAALIVGGCLTTVFFALGAFAVLKDEWWNQVRHATRRG